MVVKELISKRGYNWNNILSPNWWAYNQVSLKAGGLITVILRYIDTSEKRMLKLGTLPSWRVIMFESSEDKALQSCKSL